MRPLAAIGLVGLLASSLPGAAAQAEAKRALGLSTSWQRRRDFGQATRWAFVPELVGLAYLPSPRERIHLRPAARLGFVGLTAAEMPRALQVVERDLTGAVELGILRDGFVIPSFAVGAGLAHRWISLEVEPPLVAPAGALSERQLLPSVYALVGVGLPLAGGVAVVEPHLRYEKVFGDARLGWRVGIDLTFAAH